METIQFYNKGNMRYVLFQVDGQHYLLDRRPRHLLVYFFVSSNWFFYQNVFPITDEEYSKMNFKHSKASKFTIPTSLIVGLVVFFNSWSRLKNYNPFEHPNTTMPMTIKWTLLVLSIIVASVLIQLIYYTRKNSLEKMLGRELGQPSLYKFKPESPVKLSISIFKLLLFGIFMFIAFSVTFMYLGHILVLLGVVFMAVMVIGSVNGAFQPIGEWRYHIMDKK
ncbi:DUF443 family protein [Streptococcus pluranimalium]